MLTIEQIIQAAKGTLIQGDKSVTVRGVSTDSRTVKKGDLFIAIKGENFDGHGFLNQVARKSAAGLVVSKDAVIRNKDIPVIRVEDTVKALGHIARFYRDRFKIPVIAITGSTGKTTTKEMIAAVLGMQYRVLKNIATQNNHIGVPMTLLKLNPSHQAVVVELGTNHFGEIKWLTYIANPTVAVLTNVGESHLEFLKDEEGVFKEKSDLVKHMSAKGSVIINGDDPYLRRMDSKHLKRRLITFGINSDCDCRATDVSMSQDSQLEFKAGKKQDFLLHTPGVHNVYNALAAISCGRFLKVSYPKMKRALERFKFPQGRLSVLQTQWHTIIDDTYNANPISFRSAVDTLVNFHTPGRKILICGDMFELGKESEQFHRQLGELVSKAPIDLLMTIGKLSQFISTTARAGNQYLESYHFASVDSAYKRLRTYLRKDDVLLVKGSRGMRMERIIELIKREKKG